MRRLALNHALGLPPPAVRSDCVRNPCACPVQRPQNASLQPRGFGRLEWKTGGSISWRLRLGYQSEEATLRATVRAQFPKITLGLTRASDNSNLKSLGPNAVIDLPFFDRNQGNVAMEKATRQQLFDDYVARVYDARNDIAKAAADLRFTARREEAARARFPTLERLARSYATERRRGRVWTRWSLPVRAAVGWGQAAGGGKAAGRRWRRLSIALELASGQPSLTAAEQKSMSVFKPM